MGFILLIVAIPFFVLGVRYASDLRSLAKEKATPVNVVFTNITSSSITVSYKTESEVTGSATATGGGGVQNGTDSRDAASPGKYKLHHITIPNLKPATEYDVAIFSDGESFSAGKTKTLPLQDSISTPDPLYGKIEVSGITEALVYAVAGNSSGNSTPISEAINNNTFVLDRGSLTNPADGKKIDKSKYDIILFVDALDKGKAKIQFGADEDPPAVTLISGTAADNLKFDPAEKITFDSQPNPNPDPDPDPDTDPDPTNSYKLDAASEALLTGTYSTGAELANAYAPYNVFISNVSPSGFTVNWLTKQPTIGYIEVIEDGQRNRVVDPRDGSIANAKKRFTHSVEAKSGSIPAGTTFSFEIVSNGIKFGRNIKAVADDYNVQYKAYAQQYYPQTGGSQTSGTQTTGSTITTTKPAFTYQPSTAIIIEPFKVIVPGAPDTAPLPVAQQGTVTAAITPAALNTTLATLAAKNPELDTSKISLVRDTIVAAKTSDGTWASAIVTESNGFSLSLGSTLDTDKAKYIEVQDGDTLQVQAFSSLEQNFTGTDIYSEDPLGITLVEGNSSFLSILHTNTIKEPLLVGYGKPNSTLTLTVNSKQESVTVRQDGTWQSRSENIKAGLNEVIITDASGKSTSFDFIVDITELPVTGIGLNHIIIGLGLCMLAIGIVTYRKYN